MNKTPTTLIIMDGYGLSDDLTGNAVRAANTPVLDGLFSEYAHTTLKASGLDVGLPDGQMGTPTSAAGASCFRICRASPAPSRTAHFLKTPPIMRR